MKITKGHIALKKYVESRYDYAVDFADQVGMSRSQLCHVLSGRRNATILQAYTIEKITKGAVAMQLWAQDQLQK